MPVLCGERMIRDAFRVETTNCGPKLHRRGQGRTFPTGRSSLEDVHQGCLARYHAWGGTFGLKHPRDEPAWSAPTRGAGCSSCLSSRVGLARRFTVLGPQDRRRGSHAWSARPPQPCVGERWRAMCSRVQMVPRCHWPRPGDVSGSRVQIVQRTWLRQRRDRRLPDGVPGTGRLRRSQPNGSGCDPVWYTAGLTYDRATNTLT